MGYFMAKNSFVAEVTFNDSGISLPASCSSSNLKLHYISVTPKMVKKVITNLDLSEVSSPECIPVVVLKKSCFLDCWKVSLVVSLFKNIGERSTTKNYHPVRW